MKHQYTALITDPRREKTEKSIKLYKTTKTKQGVSRGVFFRSNKLQLKFLKAIAQTTRAWKGMRIDILQQQNRTSKDTTSKFVKNLWYTLKKEKEFDTDITVTLIQQTHMSEKCNKNPIPGTPNIEKERRTDTKNTKLTKIQYSTERVTEREREFFEIQSWNPWLKCPAREQNLHDCKR